MHGSPPRGVFIGSSAADKIILSEKYLYTKSFIYFLENTKRESGRRNIWYEFSNSRII